MDAPVASISAGTVQQLEQLEERVKYDARERKEISEKLVQLQEMRRKGFILNIACAVYRAWIYSVTRPLVRYPIYYDMTHEGAAWV